MVDPLRHQPESDWDLTRPRAERDYEALLKRVEALENAPREESWWRNPKTVAIVASLLAAFVPLTTAVDGYFKGRTNLALASAQQRHAMRMDYMKTALDPAAPEMQRQSRLRLLMAILDGDDPVRTWAQKELGVVDENVEQLKTTLQQTTAELSQVQVDEAKAKVDLSAAEDKLNGTNLPAPPRELTQEVEQAREKLQTVKQRKENLSSDAQKASEKLVGQTKGVLYAD